MASASLKSKKKKTTKKTKKKVAAKRGRPPLKKAGKKIAKRSLASVKKASKKIASAKPRTAIKKTKAVKKTNMLKTAGVTDSKPRTTKESAALLDMTIVANEVIENLVGGQRKILGAIDVLSKTISQLFHRMGDVVANLDSEVELLDDAPVETKKKTKTKTAKAAAPIEVDPFATTSVNSSDQEIKTATITEDQVVEALKEVSAACGIDDVKKCLEKFNAPRLSAIKEEERGAFIEYCHEVIRSKAPEQAASANFLD